MILKYSGIIKNDLAAAPGVCTTLFVQGCPIKCPGCHNKETWDKDGGEYFTEETFEKIKEALTANGIKRTFCIMGGEPLAEYNAHAVRDLIGRLKEEMPHLKVWVWSGYTFDNLYATKNTDIIKILWDVDGLVTGPFIEEKRDVTLRFRGSSNQEVWVKNEAGLFYRLELNDVGATELKN